MKYTLWLFLGVLFLPYIAFADVKINEVAWMGTTKSQYSEWIELYNSAEEEVSLAGWKLYKAGSDLLYTLGKTIPAQGYMLVERTTASAPDAVEGINEEAGPFGAGGLKNTGEDLSLKDITGAIVDTLSFASGWPAGDAASGKTMQWDGSAWITAEGTPDAANAVVTDVIDPVDSTESTDPDTLSPSGTSAKIVIPKVSTAPKKPALSALVPKNIFEGVPDEYSVILENADTIKGPQGYFYWNMGDGTTYVQQSPDPVFHAYQYAGSYTVSVAYYVSPAASRPVLQMSTAAVVITPLVAVEAMDGGKALKITNNTSKSIDIGHWSIRMKEGVRMLPDMTFVSAKASAVISATVLGISSIDTPVLSMPDGRSVVTH